MRVLTTAEIPMVFGGGEVWSETPPPTGNASSSNPLSTTIGGNTYTLKISTNSVAFGGKFIDFEAWLSDLGRGIDHIVGQVGDQITSVWGSIANFISNVWDHVTTWISEIF